MELVDKQDDAALGLLNFREDCLEALLELAAVGRARDDRRHRDFDDAAVLEGGGNVSRDNALGETLDDGGLADAGLANEDRVVLGAPGEDLHDAADFLIAADDRVERALLGECCEVDAKLFKGGLLLLA